MHEILHLILISSLVCGLEICTASAFSYLPPVLLKSGLSESSMTWLMGCGPLLGFIFLPVIGHQSDRCRSSYGKRRPFILIFSSIVILCLLVIPNSENIGKYFHFPSFGLALLVISSILFDFSSQACLNPCEALLYDICRGTSKEGSCFYVYSFMTSIGGCLGYLVTATNWNETIFSELFEGQEKLVFFIVALVFITTLLVTLICSNEEVHLSDDESNEKLNSTINFAKDIQFKPMYYIFTFASAIFNSIKAIIVMPMVLRRLTLAECCAWSALMTFNIFYTDFVGQTVYMGKPNADPSSIERTQYDQGVRVASYGLLLHCFVAAVYAPFSNILIKRIGIRWTFSLSMLVFALSMLIIYASRNIVVINIMASLTGLSTASLTSIPYILVTTYYSQREIYFADNVAMQKKGIGGIFGILDSVYFGSQIISSVIMGYIILIFPSTLSYIGTSFVLSLCSLWFISRIIVSSDQFDSKTKFVCVTSDLP